MVPRGARHPVTHQNVSQHYAVCIFLLLPWKGSMSLIDVPGPRKEVRPVWSMIIWWKGFLLERDTWMQLQNMRIPIWKNADISHDIYIYIYTHMAHIITFWKHMHSSSERGGSPTHSQGFSTFGLLRKFMELQPKCQIDFPDTPAGERTATVDIYQKVGSCYLEDRYIFHLPIWGLWDICQFVFFLSASFVRVLRTGSKQRPCKSVRSHSFENIIWTITKCLERVRCNGQRPNALAENTYRHLCFGGVLASRSSEAR